MQREKEKPLNFRRRLKSQAEQPPLHPMRTTAASAFSLLFCIAALLYGAGVSAQSLSCGGMLSGVGDSKFSVVQKCGEPVSKEFVCVPRPQVAWVLSPYPGGPAQQVLTQQCVPMEDWVYNRGQGSFLGIVRFYNGTVESVRDGDRVR